MTQQGRKASEARWITCVGKKDLNHKEMKMEQREVMGSWEEEEKGSDEVKR